MDALMQPNERKRDWVGIAIWTGVLLLAFSRFVHLRVGDLKDWDECLYAWRSKIVYLRGDWLDQSDLSYREFYSAAFPPLQIWYTAIMFHLFGVSEFTARIFPALTGVGTVLLMFLMGRRLARDRWAGFFAALFLGSIWFYTAYSRRAQFDVPYTFWIVASLYCYVRYADCLKITGRRQLEARPGAMKWLALAGVALGLGLMTKIVLALIAPIAAGMWAVYMWMRGRHALRRIVIEQAVMNAIAFAIILPWHLAMTLSPKGKEFWDYYIFYHLLGRSSAALEGHVGKWYYYFKTTWDEMPAPLQALSILAIAWFVLMLIQSLRAPVENVGAMRDDEADGPSRPLWHPDARYALLLAWFAFEMLLFSQSATKRNTYTIPLYPPIVLMSGLFLAERLRDTRRQGLLAVSLYFVLLLGVLSRTKSFTKGVVAAFSHLNHYAYYSPVFLKFFILLAGLAVFVAALYLATRNRPRWFHATAMAMILTVTAFLCGRDLRRVLDPEKGTRDYGWQQARPYLDAMDEYDHLVAIGEYEHPGATYYLNGLNLKPWRPTIKYTRIVEYDPAKIAELASSKERVRIVLFRDLVDEIWTPEQRDEFRKQFERIMISQKVEMYRPKQNAKASGEKAASR